MIKPGTILQDRYFVGKQIGSGGMGAVYLAIDHHFESQVAIKETYYNDEALREAFEREARLLNNLHHPALPHVSDFFTEHETHFLVMEHIEGEDLSEMLKGGKPLPAADVLRWANQLLDALDYLHSQNPPVIHRDIKPHNLKITPRGDIILLDFGLAKIETLDEQEERSIFGYSRTYSPLEQIEGTGTDVRSDIFSLAATGYHLLTGRPPISALARAAAIVSGKPDPLEPAINYNSEISLALDDILRTALAIDPNERFSSTIAMRTAIEYTLNESTEPRTEIITDEHPAKADPVIVPIGELTQESIVPVQTAVVSETAQNLAFKEISPDAQIKNSRPRQVLTPFFVPVLHGQTAPLYRKLAPIALLLCVLASGLAIWSLTASKNSSTELAQVPVALETQAMPVSADESEIVPEPESKAVEEVLTNPKGEEKVGSVPKQEERAGSVSQNSLPPATAIRKDSNLVKKTFKKPEVTVSSNVSTKDTNSPKPATIKTAQKPSIAATKIIIIPGSGLTRPRVISKRPASKSLESSASDINRFLIGKQ